MSKRVNGSGGRFTPEARMIGSWFEFRWGMMSEVKRLEGLPRTPRDHNLSPPKVA